MILGEQSKEVRSNNTIKYNRDLVVVGGGIAGVCAALTAAREGLNVILVQDRPVLGGNASGEVRMWILGATSHMGNNNRWAREGGIIDEILVENLYRNQEGNPVIFDIILLEKVSNEPNITLLLNTAVFEVSEKEDTTIKTVRAFCSQTSTEFFISGKFFIDASGDGVLGFLAGASFRMGAETQEEFGELFAPDQEYGKMLGHTIYFYSKDTGKPVKYIAPAFALKDITQIPRYKTIQSSMQGCQFWWFEYGGREEDTIVESENIKWELWKIVYGVWDYIKNSGNFPEAEHLTLEWVGTIPGKRESRRFEGDYILKQQDIVSQQNFDDAIAYGGWAIDLHPGDGVYSKLPGCNQYHSKGIYDIPYRSIISKNIDNLFLAGRIISATHVAFGSTRVMATCAHAAQAAGQAAVICFENNLVTREILQPQYLGQVQNKLNLNGQSIKGKAIDFTELNVQRPSIEVSSTYEFAEMPFNGQWTDLNQGFIQVLPLNANTKYKFKFLVMSPEQTTLEVQLVKSSKLGNYSPDTIIEALEITVPASQGATQTAHLDKLSYSNYINFSFENTIDTDQYVFLKFLPNEKVKILTSEKRITGTLSLIQKVNKAVSNNGIQQPPEGSGFDTFEFWTPERRPNGRNLAFSVSPPIALFKKEHINNGFVRPYLKSNAWAASLEDTAPEVKLMWDSPQRINRIRLFFDTDYDHPMENLLMGHPENIIPFCIQNYKVFDQDDQLVYEKTGNYQTINDIKLQSEKEFLELKFKFEHPSAHVPAALFEIVCFNEQ
ncbi:FAD-dependent oxidoreductase [Flavobacterium sp. FlaQc-48]|uniref:FAD-dependent oxidoreductase n=1 Tax=Flavobacterium sp. FlaQc-48 TaxID=3374181 RepID=UPI00375679BB